MNEQEKEDARDKQQYPPEFIARVKEEHSQQTPLTAESLMVMAYKSAGKAEELRQLRDAMTEMAHRAGNPILPEQARRDAVVLAISGVATVANSTAMSLAAMASLATEVARMKLKEIVIV